MAVSSSCTLACLPNRIPSADMDAGSEASTDLAVENAQGDVLSKRWRAKYHTSRNSWVQASWLNASKQPTVHGVALTGNLSPSALYRVVAGSGLLTPRQRMPPTSVTSYTTTYATANDGVSAPTHTEVDEDCDTALVSPDGGTRLALSGASAHVVYGFATPTSSCYTGSPVQEFRIVAGMFGAGNSADFWVALYENGVKVGTDTGIMYIRSEDMSTTLREFVVQWDAADLADSTGADVELHISTSGVLGNDVLIEAVEWNQYSTSVTGVVGDSGVLSAFDTLASLQFGDASLDDAITSINWWQAIVLSSAVEDVDQIRIDLWDRDLANRPHSTDANPVGAAGTFDVSWDPIEVGNLRAGPIFVPTSNCKAVSLGVDPFGKRTYEVTFNLLTRSETLQNLYLWGSLNAGVASRVTRTESGGTFVRGRGGPFCVLIPQPNETGVQTLQNSLVRISGRAKYKDMGMINGASTMQVTIPMTEW